MAEELVSSFFDNAEGEKGRASSSVFGIPEENDQVQPIRSKTILTIFAVCLVYFAQTLTLVGAGAVGNPSRYLIILANNYQRAQDIHSVLGEPHKSIWLTGSIAASTSILSLPVAQAAEYWGRRLLVVILTTFGIIGSLVMADSFSMNWAIAGQVISGISLGAQSLLHTICSELLPRKYRPLGQGAISFSGALGGIVAMIIGGLLTRNGNQVGFRDYEYLKAIVYTLAVIIFAVVYKPLPSVVQSSMTQMQKIRSIAWTSYLLFAMGLIAFSIGLAFIQDPSPPDNLLIIGFFLIGLVCWAVLAVYEIKFKKSKMSQQNLYSKGANFPIALVCIFVEGMSFYAVNTYFTYEVGIMYEDDGLIAGVRYSVSFVFHAIAAVITAIFCYKKKMIRWPTVGAFIMIISFFILMMAATPASSIAVWIYPAFLGLGLGAVLCTVFTMSQLSTPTDLIATTGGLMMTVRSLGGWFGLAIYNAIFTDKLDSFMPHNLEAYTESFKFVWFTANFFVFGAIIAAALFVDPVKEFTSSVDSPLRMIKKFLKEEGNFS